MTAVTKEGYLRDEGAAKRRRSIETPEGVLLHVHLAEHGSRLAALCIDLAIWVGLLLLTAIPMIVMGIDVLGTSVFLPVVILVGGLVRSFYFLFFELKWQGQTPGKRYTNIRVIDSRGGPLRAQAIVARNLTREVEVVLPLVLLMTPAEAMGMSGLEHFALSAWVGLFAVMPFLNRDRMRVGDMISGTWVVSMDDLKLGAEMADRKVGYHFTELQLDSYGRLQLRVLEDVLRREANPEKVELQIRVAEKIAKKIGYSNFIPEGETEAFLRAFYTQFRSRQETRHVMGGAKRGPSS